MPKRERKGIPYEGYEKLTRVVTVRTRKFLTNRLLKRKQMVVDITHNHLPTPRRKLVRSRIGKLFKVRDPRTIVLFGFKSKYGGGKTSGFCLIYDDYQSRKRYDMKYRLLRDGIGKKPTGSRKQRKELKNRKKKIMGRKKATAN